MNDSHLRLNKERAEKAYDAHVTALNRCQGQLANKAAQSQKLSPDGYREWIGDKKTELAGIQGELQKLKKLRAEARRQFNSWEPKLKEEWIEWPDDEGWWWNCTDGRMEIFPMFQDANDHITFTTGSNDWDDELKEKVWAPFWKYQEEPEKP